VLHFATWLSIARGCLFSAGRALRSLPTALRNLLCMDIDGGLRMVMKTGKSPEVIRVLATTPMTGYLYRAP
jgi:hypothetical protein